MPHFQAAVQAEDYNPKTATYALIRGSIELEQPQKAEEYYQEYIQTYGSPPAAEAEHYTAMIEKAKMPK